jgi:hypothetical protein
MGVYVNYERERRETGTTKELWTDRTGGLNRLIEYTKNRFISWNINKDYVWKIKN